MIQSFKDTVDFDDSRTDICEFKPMTIRRGKQVIFHLNIPIRLYPNYWGGIYVGLNIEMPDGSIINLGNDGYNFMFRDSDQSINVYRRTYYLDFQQNYPDLTIDKDFEIKVTLFASTYDGTGRVNGNHDLNSSTRELNTDNDGNVIPYSEMTSDQAFVTLVTEETEGIVDLGEV